MRLWETSGQWGQLLTWWLLAVALGLDAFSLCVGIGLAGIRLRQVMRVSGTIGAFHVMMPLIGVALGQVLVPFVGSLATLLGGLLLSFLGLHMLWHASRGHAQPTGVYLSGTGLLLFALTVSLDALSVGFSLGLLAGSAALAVALFGLMGFLMAGFGLLVGRRVGRWLGEYSEAFGGLILVAFGFKLIVGG